MTPPTFEMNGPELHQALYNAALMASNDEMRPVLCGVHLGASAGELVFTSTNSFIGSRAVVPVDVMSQHEKIDVILPTKQVRRLLSMIEKKRYVRKNRTEPVKYEFTLIPSGSHVVVGCSDWTYTFAPQEGDYPAESIGKMIDEAKGAVVTGEEIGLGLNTYLMGQIAKIHGGEAPGSAPGLHAGMAMKFKVQSAHKPIYGEVRCGPSILEILCMPYKMA